MGPSTTKPRWLHKRHTAATTPLAPHTAAHFERRLGNALCKHRIVHARAACRQLEAAPRHEAVQAHRQRRLPHGLHTLQPTDAPTPPNTRGTSFYPHVKCSNAFHR